MSMQVSDERIAEILARPGGLHRAQMQATQAWQRAAAMPWAPASAISGRWASHQSRAAAARTDAAKVRAAMEAEAEMSAIADAHAALSEDAKRTAWSRDKEGHAIAAYQHNMQANIAAGAARVAREPGFSVAGFLGQLAGRGCVVSAERGKLVVRGAPLDETGRRVLAEHRDAVLAALTGPGEVF